MWGEKPRLAQYKEITMDYDNCVNMNIFAEDRKVAICSACDQECGVEEYDCGFGYEYWGSRGHVDNVAWLSDCCGAPII